MKNWVHQNQLETPQIWDRYRGMALGLLLHDSQWCKEAMATTRKANGFSKS